MTEPADTSWADFNLDPHLRRSLYALLILATLAVCLGRVASVRSKDGRSPFHSANDRSRWCTIRNLVERNSYVIDRLQADKQWHTIDKVRHRGVRGDDEEHYYSSKPPLLPTLIASQYYILHHAFGLSFAEHPFQVARIILTLTNVVPLAIYLLLMTLLIERWCGTDWGRLFAVAAACLGTFLTTFVITLNNHLPAAICTLIALHAFLAIWYEEKQHPAYFVAAGLTAAFAAANELPALSLLGLLGLALLIKNWKSTVIWGVPAVAVVATAFFVLNYVAHESLRPPYMHRSEGDNWYDYPGSYWTGERQGVDAGEPSQWVYAFHSLVGHHGVLSLTPIWCLSLVGVVLLARDDREVPMKALALGISTLTAICLVFYIFLRPEIDRNYGGVSAGFRWMFWFTPLWLFAMLPALEAITYSKLGRRIAYAFLAVSVFSASYPFANPWQHPWLYTLLDYLGLPV